MSINEVQDEVIAEFNDFDDWMDRYQLLIDLGNEQEPLDVPFGGGFICQAVFIVVCKFITHVIVEISSALLEDGFCHYQVILYFLIGNESVLSFDF